MKFRDRRVQKFFATIINISDKFNFYEVPSDLTRYETVFCDGYINGDKFMFVLINYKIMPIEFILKDASAHKQLIISIWERCME